MLIHCVAYFQDGNRLADFPVENISDHNALPDRFVWVALRDATDAELDTMQEEFNLHDLSIEDARHGHQRPKIEEYDDSLFAAMHIVESGKDALHVGELHVFVGRNFVLSICNGCQEHLSSVRERCERHPEMLTLGAGFVFYALMDAVVDGYFPLIDAFECELETIEERIFTKGAAHHNIRSLYALKRKATLLRHAVAPLMEAAGKLYSGRVPAACEKGRDYFRDVYDHLVRINTSLETIRETIATAIQVNLSMVAIEDSDTNKRLAAWAAIFAIATAFAGIWGMNFKHMPEINWEFGYPMALGGISTICILLYVRFRRLGWL